MGTMGALEDASGTVERMGTKLLRVLDYFMMTGPGALMQCIEEGDIAAFAKADFSDAVEEVESLVQELDELLVVSRSVVKIMENVRGIAADVNEIIDGFLGDMKNHCSEAKESLDRFLRDDLAKGKEYL